MSGAVLVASRERIPSRTPVSGAARHTECEVPRGALLLVRGSRAAACLPRSARGAQMLEESSEPTLEVERDRSPHRNPGVTYVVYGFIAYSYLCVRGPVRGKQSAHTHHRSGVLGRVRAVVGRRRLRGHHPPDFLHNPWGAADYIQLL